MLLSPEATTIAAGTGVLTAIPRTSRRIPSSATSTATSPRGRCSRGTTPWPRSSRRGSGARRPQRARSGSTVGASSRVDAYEKSAKKYRDCFDPDAMIDYEDAPSEFKTVLAKRCETTPARAQLQEPRPQGMDHPLQGRVVAGKFLDVLPVLLAAPAAAVRGALPRRLGPGSRRLRRVRRRRLARPPLRRALRRRLDAQDARGHRDGHPFGRAALPQRAALPATEPRRALRALSSDRPRKVRHAQPDVPLPHDRRRPPATR